MEEARENCYFWIDATVPLEQRTIKVFCVKCHDEKHPNLGWPWEGSKLGYGPFDYVCEECKRVVHSGKNPRR